MNNFDNLVRILEMKAASNAWKQYAAQRVRTDLTEADLDFLRRACESQKARFNAAKAVYDGYRLGGSCEEFIVGVANGV